LINPLDVWAPIFRAPFSGDVTQEIAPRLLSPDIKGNPEIERKVQTEVASFGKQLGKILEALRALSAATETPLPDIEKLYQEVEAIKEDHKDRLRAEAEAALEKLKAADKEAWQKIIDAS
jgi:small-conductance mechanosensitive channel